MSSNTVTRGVRVDVQSDYAPERSDPHRGLWFFAYRIRITNEGVEEVQLMTRSWLITDAEGRREEVHGPGVVGEQPILGPGECFEYTSWCPLPTPFGSMQGSYRMLTARGEEFDARIGSFALCEPNAIN